MSGPRRLFVRNYVSETTTEQSLVNVFSPFGLLSSVRMTDKAYAFIEFVAPASAARALAAHQSRALETGGRSLVVEISSSNAIDKRRDGRTAATSRGKRKKDKRRAQESRAPTPTPPPPPMLMPSKILARAPSPAPSQIPLPPPTVGTILLQRRGGDKGRDGGRGGAKAQTKGTAKRKARGRDKDDGGSNSNDNDRGKSTGASMGAVVDTSTGAGRFARPPRILESTAERRGEKGRPGAGSMSGSASRASKAQVIGGAAGASRVKAGDVVTLIGPESAKCTDEDGGVCGGKGSKALIFTSPSNCSSLQLHDKNTLFCVAGVLGLEGVGKSTCMSLLCNADVSGAWRARFDTSPLLQQNEKQFQGCHVGVRATVTADRLVLLDSQAVLSATHLMRTANSRGRARGISARSQCCGEMLESLHAAEQEVEAQSLRLAVFMLSVCHVVLVVDDGRGTSALRDLVRAANALIRGTSPLLLSVPTQSVAARRHVAKIVWVCNRVRDSATARCANLLADTASMEGGSAPLFVLPYLPMPLAKQQMSVNARNCVGVHRLRHYILGTQWPSLYDAGNDGKERGRAVSEQSWLQTASHVWDRLQHSKAILAYMREIHNLTPATGE